MCGIAVSFNSLGRAARIDLELIHHRGPDSQGEWRAPDARYWLGNTRLALIGPSDKITPAAVSAYLQWGSCPEGELIYLRVQALPAGHAMTIAADGSIETWRYWPAQTAFVSPPDKVLPRVRRLIDKAVEE